MQGTVYQIYRRTANKYRKFALRLEKNIASGRFAKETKYCQNRLIQRVEKLRRRLNQLMLQLKIGAAATVAVTALAATSSETKAQGLGPFTNVNRVLNPLRAPIQIYSYNLIGHALGDIDQDGDVDMLVGYYDDSPGVNQGYIRTFKNFQVEYGAPKPVFMEVANGALPYTISNSDATFAASFVDLDGDGLEELAIAVGYYEPVEFLQNDNDGTGNFSLISPAGISIDADQHTSNMVSVDIDNDGDLDLVTGSTWASTGIYFWENNGANNFALIGHTLSAGPINYATPAFFDIDNDGDLDLFMGDNTGVVHFFRNNDFETDGVIDDPDDFIQEDTNVLNFLGGTDFGSYTLPRFVDLDMDGDLDMVLSKIAGAGPNNGYLHVFYNDGANNFTEATGLDNPFGGVQGPEYDQKGKSNLSFGDIDNDGDLDLVMGAYDGSIYFYENVGDAFERRLGVANPVYFTQAIGDTQMYPSLSDIDGDGDLDLLNGTNGSYDGLYLYLNTGTPFVPDITYANKTPNSLTTLISGASIWDYIQPDFVDFDGDGDLDLITTGIYNLSGYAYIFLNDGTPPAINFSGSSSIGTSRSYRNNVEPVDIDHDGDYDLLIGETSGGNLEIDINNAGWSPIVTNPFNAFNLSPESPASRAAPAAIDFDGDGDLDVFVGRADGQVNFLRNDNAPPIVNLDPSPLVFTENGPAVPLDPTLTITDPDANANIVAGILSITNFVPAEDVISYSTVNGITGVTTGNTITFTGYTTPLQWEAALQSITYQNTSEDPDPTPRIISFEVRDSDYTIPSAFTRILNVVPVNDLPVLTPGITSIDYTGGEGPKVIDASLLLNDIDNTSLVSADVVIATNYVSSEDQLSFTTIGSITGTFSAGTLSLSGPGTLAEYQSALQSVTYENTNFQPDTTPRTVSMVVNDGTNDSVLENFTINVLSTPAPILSSSGTGAVSYTENGPPLIIDSGFTINFAGPQVSGASISITIYQAGEDILAFTPINGITGTFDTATGVLTLSGSATLADYEQGLATITYNNTSDNPTTSDRTISFTVSESGNTSNAIATTLSVAVVNDAPAISSAASDNNYRSLTGKSVIDNQITITDIDNTNLMIATISISGNYSAGEDLLAFQDQNGITGSFNSVSGVLSLSVSATVADYQAALRSVSYENTVNAPTSNSKEITFEVSEGSAASNSQLRTINVTDNVVTATAINTQVDIGNVITIDVLSQATFNPVDNITVSIITPPSSGTAVVNADGSIGYTPDNNAITDDQIEYELCNEFNSCGTETISITISNEPPVITQATPANASPGGSVTIPLGTNIYDPNGNADNNSLAIVFQPGSGAIASIDASQNLTVDYSGTNFTGADRLTVEVCDLSGACTEQEIVIIVGELDHVNVFNAVSPNGDNLHDFLHLQDIEFFASNEVFIYDKNGRLVYNTTDYDNSDPNKVFVGKSNEGEDLPNGTYYYAFQMISVEGNKFNQSGFFVLNR